MAVGVQWADQAEDILLYQFGKSWTWDAYESALMQGRAMMRSKPHYVGVVIDMRATDAGPPMVMARTKGYIETRPVNTGLVVFVGDSLFFRTFYRMFANIFPRFGAQYVAEADIDAAIQRIRDWLANAAPPPTAG
ncbi:MAG: hypothetical protein ACOCYT_04120 [Chloroflexota bacterium]